MNLYLEAEIISMGNQPSIATRFKNNISCNFSIKLINKIGRVFFETFLIKKVLVTISSKFVIGIYLNFRQLVYGNFTKKYGI